MIKQLLTASVFAAVTTTAQAQSVCEMSGAVPVPLFEQAKAAFLREDFDGFADVTTEVMGDNGRALDAPLKQLRGLIPNGFDGCQTIVQRRDVGGMIQEVSTFTLRGQAFPISVYLLAIPIRGEMKIGYVGFNTSLVSVLENLK
jgi:hypothetical protein